MAAIPTPLDDLEQATGRTFDTLRDAERRSNDLLVQISTIASNVTTPGPGCFVVMGSIAREEATSGSDVDFLFTVPDRPEGMTEWAEYEAAITAFGNALEARRMKPPAKDGTFGMPVDVSQVCAKIGRDPDTDTNLTQRILMLLEARPVGDSDIWPGLRRQVLETYLGASHLKDNRPPRFFLNDVIRYWRTICVDYEGKVRDKNHDRWAIRNAKLRTSRKMLFASGLLPLLRCGFLPRDEVEGFLEAQFDLVPVMRVIDAFNKLERSAEGADVIAAYAGFLALLDDETARRELESLAPEDRATSETWQTVKESAQTIQDGLETLLFDTDLAPLIRRFVVF